MKELRVQVRLFNNRLRERREALGLSAPKLAEQIGIDYHSYLLLEGLKKKPITTRGEWRPIALKLAEFYSVDPDELFPDGVQAIENRETERRLDAEEIAVMALPEQQTPFELVAGVERKVAVQEAFDSLTTRERTVLELRFGDSLTLDEIAEQLDVSRERIRQIEAQALRKMRHPSRSTPIVKAWLGEGDRDST